MTPAQLRDAWQQAYRANAPRLSPDLLRHGVAYRLQEQAGKPLSASAQRQLRPQLNGAPAPSTISVAVEDDGYRYEGRRYTSLTSIAREVTGAAWSGPRFFGLTQRRAA